MTSWGITPSQHSIWPFEIQTLRISDPHCIYKKVNDVKPDAVFPFPLWLKVILSEDWAPILPLWMPAGSVWMEQDWRSGKLLSSGLSGLDEPWGTVLSTFQLLRPASFERNDFEWPGWRATLGLAGDTSWQAPTPTKTSNNIIAGNGRVLKAYVFIMWLYLF